MYFILQRYSDNNESTLGLMFEKVQDKLRFENYILEDEYRAKKVAGETRVDAGLFELKIQEIVTPLTKKYRERYPWFENHIEITGLPRHTSVYLHIGNNDDDTDACPLFGDMANNNAVNEGEVTYSTQAFKRWYLKVYPHLKAGKRAWIEIRDEKHLLA